MIGPVAWMRTNCVVPLRIGVRCDWPAVSLPSFSVNSAVGFCSVCPSNELSVELSGQIGAYLPDRRYSAEKSRSSLVVPIVAAVGSMYTSTWVGAMGISGIATGLGLTVTP